METTKVIRRESLMAKLEKKYPKMFLRTTEEFDGGSGGIWTSAENIVLDNSRMPLFNYYADDYNEVSYIMGVRKSLHDFLEKNGWYCEFYDAGTVMIYPNY
jgi:hypothetical protein